MKKRPKVSGLFNRPFQWIHSNREQEFPSMVLLKPAVSPLFSLFFSFFALVVNQLRKGYVYETLLNYDVQYDNTWIYDKNHHEINQSCSIILFKKFISMFLIRLMKRCKLLFKVLVHVMCLVLKS
ncbi:PREDICTED: erlin-1-like isoform X3 [Populus euphratica]|uniref:Erlin-1-like isoform X3 n=1 Tax=Populus euphratica TaxID=75702 RepID=A0AAJ6XH93_POPEU|nr:PREDICTED: erlin-1-like isoform X3 [Populus euphratica]